jgi:hypothetical protein
MFVTLTLFNIFIMVTNLFSVQRAIKEAERRCNKYIFEIYGFKTYDFVNQLRASPYGVFVFARFIVEFSFSMISRFYRNVLKQPAA